MTISRNLSFLAEGVSSTGVLGATYGGTGQSSITTGDLLYGSASNTISKLGIGSTGTILRVVGGVPTWGTDYTGTVTSVAASVPSFLSISGSPITTSGTLAITYSGTALPIANGGTAQTSFTAGQVLYGSFSQSSNLYFDGTNLGIGNSTPSSFNSLAKQLVVGSGSTDQGLTIYSSTTGYGSLFFAKGTTSSQAYQGYIQYQMSTDSLQFGTAATERMRISSSGYLGINTTSPSTLLDIRLTSGTGTIATFGNALYSYGTIGTATGSNFQVLGASGNNLQLGGNATVAATIFNSGGVSIGNTTDPGAGNLRFNTTGSNGIYFGSSSQLSDYETGTWTPIDGSGASLSLTIYSATYIRVGRMVFATFDIAYPVTANTSYNRLLGVPYTMASGSWACAVAYATSAVATGGFGNGGATSLDFYGAGSTRLINSALSGKEVAGCLIFQV